MIHVPISVGELIDKISILNIKSFKILDKQKARIVRQELRKLLPLVESYLSDPPTEDLYTDLLSVNINLWEAEDLLRVKESKQEFDDEFIQLARIIYQQNDIRADIKRKINQAWDEEIQEVKQYVEYGS